MVTISKFYPSAVKQSRVFLVIPDVPNFWKGFYAIYQPTNKGEGWTKRWHASNKGKTISKAFAKIDVANAHKIDWQHYMKF